MDRFSGGGAAHQKQIGAMSLALHAQLQWDNNPWEQWQWNHHKEPSGQKMRRRKNSPMWPQMGPMWPQISHRQWLLGAQLKARYSIV
jgi:hypothetical protein